MTLSATVPGLAEFEDAAAVLEGVISATPLDKGALLISDDKPRPGLLIPGDWSVGTPLLVERPRIAVTQVPDARWSLDVGHWISIAKSMPSGGRAHR